MGDFYGIEQLLDDAGHLGADVDGPGGLQDARGLDREPDVAAGDLGVVHRRRGLRVHSFVHKEYDRDQDGERDDTAENLHSRSP